MTSPTLKRSLRLAQLLVDDFHVVALQIEDRGVAQDVHVGGRRIEQGVLLGIRQGLTGAENRALGLLDRILGPEAVEKVLVDLETDATGVEALDIAGAARALEIGVAAARIRRGVDLRPVTGLGAGDVLVGRADIGPLRVEVRVVAVGARQGALQRLCGSATDQGQHEDRRHRSEESVPCPAKSNVVHAHLPVGSTDFDQPTVSLRCIKPTRCQTKQYPCGTSRQSDRHR